MDTGIRILIADDSEPFRKGLRTMLATIPDMQVVGEASNGAEAIQQALELQPDVILMDLKMPDMHGIKATARITQTSPHIRILVVTMSKDDDSVFASMRAGARGYLVKGAGQDEITRAIRAVNNNEVIFSSKIAQLTLEMFTQAKHPQSDQLLFSQLTERELEVLRLIARGSDNSQVYSDRLLFPQLTERELEVLRLIARGYTNSQIAGELFISEKTVRNHVSNIYEKLQVRSRIEAMLLALRAGLK